MMDMNINFPNLGIELNHVGKSISIFGFEIALFGIVISLGMLAGICITRREARLTGQNPDTYIDLAIYTMIAAVAGARIYYVLFSWDYYKQDLWSILNLRAGGLAIYGAVIAGGIAIYVYGRIKKISPWLMADTVSIGLLTGQIIGRLGNFFNREAFGGYTDNLFAMQLPVGAVRANEITEEMLAHLVKINSVDYIQVHAAFLYECIWNLAVLIIVLIVRRVKKFNGQIVLVYIIGYSLGRIWIEDLRTDQLLLPATKLPVSQVVAVIMVLISVVIILVKHIRIKITERKGKINAKCG